MLEVRYPWVTVELVGGSGNAFAIIGAVEAALKEQVNEDAGVAFVREALAQGSYDELLWLVQNTVIVE